MKTPSHWRTKNLLAWSLFPLGCFYAFATWCRLKFHRPNKMSIPVICVGNLTAGGSGKTPVSIGLATLLKACGKNPFFISRGYGGTLQNVLVDPKHHTPQQVGDEPLLLSKTAPVVVNADRHAAAQKAFEQGADILIMDDGFQNPSLYKDKSFLVVDGSIGMGNLMPIPAGPMREFFSQGLKRAQAVIFLGEDAHNLLPLFKGIPVFRGDVIPQKPSSSEKKAFAFAGIGHPKKFYQSLEESGITLEKTTDFPDHHFYTKTELDTLINQAETAKADLYTTSKDMVKIPFDLRKNIKVLEITIRWRDEEKLRNFLLG